MIDGLESGQAQVTRLMPLPDEDEGLKMVDIQLAIAQKQREVVLSPGPYGGAALA
jgi:hypothetical protein